MDKIQSIAYGRFLGSPSVQQQLDIAQLTLGQHLIRTASEQGA